MFGLRKKGMRYKVSEVGIEVISANQPSSTYFKIGLDPLGEDDFKVKQQRIFLTLTLHDILELELNKETKDTVEYLLNFKDVESSQWDKEHAYISNQIQKILYGKILKLEKD